MAEEKAPSRISGWIKAGITSVMGLCSGAVLMYVSPLVTSAIKPGKPLANFGQQAQGLTVTFQNRATGATEGWWDFGDGSPLEHFSPSQETVTHAFARPGSYNVKLSLRNFLGEESERTVPVNLDGAGASAPAIEAFKVDPVWPDPTSAPNLKSATAPATFRVASQIKNADLCIWSLGEDRPLEVSSDTSPSQERLVTIKEPGYYTLRLVAVSGKQTVEKSESVFVNAGDSAAAVATLQVSFQAVQVKRLSKEVVLPPIVFPADRKETAYPFSVPHAESDYQIIEAKFAKPVKEAGVRNPKLALSADKSKVDLTGELVKPGGLMAWQKNPPPVQWAPIIALSLERRSETMLQTSEPIAAELKVPGSTLLPLPKLSSRWQVQSATATLELRDGATLVYKDSKLPAMATLQFKGRPYHLTATLEQDHVRVELVYAGATLRPIGN